MSKSAAHLVAPFTPEALYRKPEARRPLSLSDRGFDAFVARFGIPRVELSKRAIRFRGVDLNAALSRATHGGEA